MASTSSVYETLGMKVSNFNVVVATIGAFLTLFGLVSYLLKERFYLGEAIISTIAGVIFSPHAANLVRPLEYARGSTETLDAITLYFSRLVLGVQLVLAGIQLPSKYLWKERKPLALLLGPGMCVMWISTSFLVWALVPNLNILQALAVGACVTPTDPVLSNSVVKGKFADKNIPKPLQRIIIAESGANDGLGYPFLFLPLYLLRYTHDAGAGQTGGAAKAMGYWFGITWGYVIIMSIIYGAVVGWIFKEALHWAENRKYVDRESFLVFAITLALFIVGTLGMVGSDDVLACFIAGNVFTWDDWFRVETEDDSFQPTIDMLLNVSIFAWYGAVCPWYSFVHNDIVPIYRLIPLGILVLLLRRPPIVFAMHHKIEQIEEPRQALFVGFFGPIGVSAIFYIYTSVEFLSQITVDGVQREDAAHLSETIRIVVWFMVICSIIVHGLSIPIGKLGIELPRTISMSRATTTEKQSANTQTPIMQRIDASPRNNSRGNPDGSPGGSVNGSRDDPDEPKPLHLVQDAEHGIHELERALSRLEQGESKKHGERKPSVQSENISSSNHRLPRSLFGIDGLLKRGTSRDNQEKADSVDHKIGDGDEKYIPGVTTPRGRTIEGIKFTKTQSKERPNGSSSVPQGTIIQPSSNPAPRSETPTGRTIEGVKFGKSTSTDRGEGVPQSPSKAHSKSGRGTKSGAEPGLSETTTASAVTEGLAARRQIRFPSFSAQVGSHGRGVKGDGEKGKGRAA